MGSSAASATEHAWDYDRAELIADGIVHVIGVLLAVVGAAAIIAVAANSSHSRDIAAIVVYSIGLLSMLGFSAAYNTWPVSRAKWVLRRFDHSAIYLMIAGTYTPFMAYMKSGLVSLGLLGTIWSAAGAGIVFKLLLPGRFDNWAVPLYLLLGWSGAIIYQEILAALPVPSIVLLGVGGAFYTIGVVFHFWESLRFQNAIWHVFVLVAACCHYSAVTVLLV